MKNAVTPVWFGAPATVRTKAPAVLLTIASAPSVQMENRNDIFLHWPPARVLGTPERCVNTVWEPGQIASGRKYKKWIPEATFGERLGVRGRLTPSNISFELLHFSAVCVCITILMQYCAKPYDHWRNKAKPDH